MINKVHFKTNILLKNIIGKDLITDDNVAMLELVKNSYDAGSKIVEIVFQNVVNNDDLDVTLNMFFQIIQYETRYINTGTQEF